MLGHPMGAATPHGGSRCGNRSNMQARSRGEVVLNTKALETLAQGQEFRMPALGLAGVVEHVSPSMVRVAIRGRLGEPLEHTTWSCSTEVEAIPATAGIPVSTAHAQARMGAERAEQNSSGNWTPQFRHTVSALECAGCGQRQPRARGPGRPRRYCSSACRTAAYRERRTRHTARQKAHETRDALRLRALANGLESTPTADAAVR
jgi:hypothetical protein